MKIHLPEYTQAGVSTRCISTEAISEFALTVRQYKGEVINSCTVIYNQKSSVKLKYNWTNIISLHANNKFFLWLHINTSKVKLNFKKRKSKVKLN